MIQLERAAADILSELPKNHPERKMLEGYLQVFQNYNTLQQQGNKVAEAAVFTSEARDTLGKRGYEIYTLSGQSIKSLRDGGGKFWSEWYQKYPEFEAQPSRLSEVAFNPKELFLKDSNRKTLGEQMNMVVKFSQELQKGRNRIAGVEAIIGDAADYVELAFLHLERSHQYLFGSDYGFNYTRTASRVGGRSVDVGNFNPGSGLDVHDWDPAERIGSLWVAPLVVPA